MPLDSELESTQRSSQTALALPSPQESAQTTRAPLLPERASYLEGDSPAAAKVEAFLTQALAATNIPGAAGALVPWICDVLLSNHSVKAYGRDLTDFTRHMEA